MFGVKNKDLGNLLVNGDKMVVNYMQNSKDSFGYSLGVTHTKTTMKPIKISPLNLLSLLTPYLQHYQELL